MTVWDSPEMFLRVAEAARSAERAMARLNHDLSHDGEGVKRGCEWCADRLREAGYRP